MTKTNKEGEKKYKFSDVVFRDLLEEQAYIQSIDPTWESGCPCSEFTVYLPGGKIEFRTRCWRVAENSQDLIVKSKNLNKEMWANLVKENLDRQEWYNEYTIIYE